MTRAVAELAEQGANVRKLNQIMAENARQLRDLRTAAPGTPWQQRPPATVYRPATTPAAASATI